MNDDCVSKPAVDGPKTLGSHQLGRVRGAVGGMVPGLPPLRSVGVFQMP